jgi:hypothetical protein
MWPLVILMCFHPLESMPKCQCLHTIHNHHNNIHVITVSTSARMPALDLVHPCYCSLIVYCLYALACWFDLMEFYEVKQKFVGCCNAKQFCSCRAKHHWDTIN